MSEKTLKEEFRFAPELKMELFVTRKHQTLVHSHDCLEIGYVTQGRGHYRIEEKTYPIETGDIFVINNREHHIAYHDGVMEMLVLVFDPEFVWTAKEYEYLKPFFARSANFSNRITAESVHYSRLKEYLFTVRDEFAGREAGYDLAIKAALLMFLAILYRHYSGRNELYSQDSAYQKAYDRIRPCLSFMQEHYREDITLEELANLVHMNKTYLSDYFKKVMNMGLFDYLEQLRLHKACLLLTSTDDSVTVIADLTGFNSVSYFNRFFKKLTGSTPTVYRKEAAQSAFQR